MNAANETIVQWTDPLREDPEGGDKERHADDEQDPGRHAGSLAETAGVASGNEGPHDDVGDQFGQIDDDEDLDCQKQELSLSGQEPL